MAELKTTEDPDLKAVDAYLAGIADEPRRRDVEAIVAMMAEAVGEPPRMWGPSIVGFGKYRYQYESGHGGEMCLVGLSSRKDAISLYLNLPGDRREELLGGLGKFKAAKACLYVKRLADVDAGQLARLIAIGAATSRDLDRS